MGTEVQQISKDTYKITANGKTYAGKLVEDGADKETAQTDSSKTSTSASTKTSLFTAPQYQRGLNNWQYNLTNCGSPSDTISVDNDNQVFQYENKANNIGAQYALMGQQMTSFLDAMNAQKMSWIEQLMNNISSGNTQTKSKTKSKTEAADDNTTEELKKALADLDKMKKELEEAKKVKPHRDTLKSTIDFDNKVENITQKLRNGMSGGNLSSWFGDTGGDKEVKDALDEVDSKNVVEVMETYKTKFCDTQEMGNDNSLVESIYDDFTDNWTGNKYSPKIDLLRDALMQRAQQILDKHGEESGITAADIAAFKGAVETNKDAGGFHFGSAGKLPKIFEDFKDKIKASEGTTDTIAVKPKDKTETDKDNATTTSTTSSTSTDKTAEEKDKEEKDKDKK